jgi:hypothetical protein
MPLNKAMFLLYQDSFPSQKSTYSYNFQKLSKTTDLSVAILESLPFTARLEKMRSKGLVTSAANTSCVISNVLRVVDDSMTEFCHFHVVITTLQISNEYRILLH